MANTSAFFSHLIPFLSTNSFRLHNSSQRNLLFTHHQKHKRSFLLTASASSLALPINVDYLEREFSGHGVRFERIGDSCVVKMGLENGSMASLMLPSGLITSYKPFMWHGSTFEMLHTTVSEGENGEIEIQGGVSMDLNCVNDDGMPWSSSKWALLDVRGSSEKAIQVELVAIGPKDMVEVKCLVTLQADLLGSELTITNPRSTSLQFLGSVISHLTVSTPDATYAVGLQGSNYYCKQPIISDFSIIPPDSNDERLTSTQSWAYKGFGALFSNSGRRGGNRDEWGDEGEEDDDYAQMTDKMSRIYTTAPREFTIIDRGRRNSVIVRRNGFDELYVFSPGSEYEWYGKYAYICIGPSAVLKPVTLGPGCAWRGAQYLYNPNL